MVNTLLSCSLSALLAGSTCASLMPGTPEGTVPVYRLYNTNTGEHFYTASKGERDHLISVGWSYEGSGWQSSSKGDPVYRVYNPNAKGGDHYYTVNKEEATHLVSLGWKWDNEGKPVFVSAGKCALYVAYNPNAQSGAHNYTTSLTEQNHLTSVGWIYPETAWQVAAKGISEGHPLNRTAKADTDLTGPGGAEARVPGSYRTIYSNKPFDYTDLDGEVPEIAFSCDIAISGKGKSDYETQFVIAGNGEGSGQVGVQLHYQAGRDEAFGQGRICTQVINFPADAGVHGEQFYSVTTVAPKVVDGQSVHLEVQYYKKGWMTAFVNDQLVGMYQTKLTTPNRYILHNFCNTDNTIRNLKVEKNGKDVTFDGAPSFSADHYDNQALVNGAY